MLKRLSNAPPILMWAGATSGSRNLLANGTLNFTTVGTYTFTVTRSVRVNINAAGAGADGVAAGLSANGGNGGASGAVGNVASVLLTPGVTYEIRVPAHGSGNSAYLKVQAGAALIEMGSGVGRTTPGTVITGTGVAGANGGLGGGYATVAPGGAPGSLTGAGGAGGGGGGGTQGSTVLGGGGSGGGMSNGTADHGTVPGQGDPGGVGLAIVVAGVNTAGGGGGASSGDTGSGGNTPGYPGAVQVVFVP